jgi:hypothetical protein
MAIKEKLNLSIMLSYLMSNYNIEIWQNPVNVNQNKNLLEFTIFFTKTAW